MKWNVKWNETTLLGRITRTSESASALAPRADLTPEVTHSSDVSHLEPTMAMVLRSQVRDGRSSVAIGNPAEIPVFVYTCQPGLGATGPTVVESVTKQIGTHPVTPENNTHLSFHTSPGTTLDSHTRLTKWSVACINWVSRKKWIWENRHWSCGRASG